MNMGEKTRYTRENVCCRYIKYRNQFEARRIVIGFWKVLVIILGSWNLFIPYLELIYSFLATLQTNCFKYVVLRN